MSRTPVCGIVGYISHDLSSGAQRFTSEGLGTAPEYGSHGPPWTAEKTADTVSALNEWWDGIDRTDARVTASAAARSTHIILS